MSRCYPFPPPGYVRNETRDDYLIESIKNKGTKEEVKREKKDRKHKDKKRKERDNETDQRSKKHRRHKRRCKDDASKKVEDGCGLVENNELECLEKSCLTVELEHQTSSQNSCDSSTLYSNERPKHVQSPPLDGRQYGSETGIRILLHGKEHEIQDAEVMITKTHKQCCSRASLDASQTTPSESCGHTSLNEAPLDPLRVCQEKRTREITTKLSKEKKTVPLESDRPISMSLGKEKPSSSHQETLGASKLCSKCSPSTAVQFLNLIENWTPDLVESKLTDSENQELWLVMKVGAKRHHHHQVSNQTISNGSSSMAWPTALLLPEAELHALPFTVPF